MIRDRRKADNRKRLSVLPQCNPPQALSADTPAPAPTASDFAHSKRKLSRTARISAWLAS